MNRGDFFCAFKNEGYGIIIISTMSILKILND